MHELSIARGILDLLREHAPGDAAGRVRVVQIRLGPLAGISPGVLAFGFKALARETPYRSAQLRIETTPLACRCDACGHRCETDSVPSACSECGCARLTVQGGTDLDVVGLELVDSPLEVT